MKEKLRMLLEDNTTKEGRLVDFIIQVLIFMSLLAFAIETLPNTSPELLYILNVFEYICVAIFTVEYTLRVLVAKKPSVYIFSFYGLVDLLAVLPFYVNLALDLRMLRAFRIFRVFRALKLIRYDRALQRINLTFKIVREELVLFFIITAIFIYLTACGIYYFEHVSQPELFSSVFHSLWWSIVTLTTVGYGDVYPITIGGKIFTFLVLIIGVGIVTVPAGLVASALSKAREIEQEEFDSIKN